MDVDVAIAGGGQIGLTLALALKQADPTLGVVVMDARAATGDADPRASAIAAAARRMLTRLGVWETLAPEAEPIRTMTITDSRLGDAVRPTLLAFDGEIEPGEAFAHMVANEALSAALAKAALAAGVAIEAPAKVVDFAVGPSEVAITLAGGRRLTARLLIAADGVRSHLRDLAGIHVVRRDYRQSAIVTTIAHEQPHEGRAEEHFLPGGPFAVLPLTHDRVSIVWTEQRAVADALVGLDDGLFLFELEQRLGHRLGRLTLAGPRASIPLGLLIARSFVKPRFAVIGDAAHGIHPIAGQGLNIGFRDVAALAEAVIEARRIGLDIGSLAILEPYERRRRFDAVEMGLVTDGLNRLFSNDIAPLRTLRDIGLGLVDRMPRLKRRLITEAAGLAGDTPRLLRGEAI